MNPESAASMVDRVFRRRDLVASAREVVTVADSFDLSASSQAQSSAVVDPVPDTARPPKAPAQLPLPIMTPLGWRLPKVTPANGAALIAEPQAFTPMDDKGQRTPTPDTIPNPSVEEQRRPSGSLPVSTLEKLHEKLDDLPVTDTTPSTPASPATPVPSMPSSPSPAEQPTQAELDADRVEQILPEGVQVPQRGGAPVEWVNGNGTQGSLRIDEYGQRHWRHLLSNGRLIEVTEGGGSDGADRPWTRTKITEPGDTTPRVDTYATTAVTVHAETIGGVDIRDLRFQNGDLGIEEHHGGDEGARRPWTRTTQYTPLGPFITTDTQDGTTRQNPTGNNQVELVYVGKDGKRSGQLVPDDPTQPVTGWTALLGGVTQESTTLNGTIIGGRYLDRDGIDLGSYTVVNGTSIFIASQEYIDRKWREIGITYLRVEVGPDGKATTYFQDNTSWKVLQRETRIGDLPGQVPPTDIQARNIFQVLGHPFAVLGESLLSFAGDVDNAWVNRDSALSVAPPNPDRHPIGYYLPLSQMRHTPGEVFWAAIDVVGIATLFAPLPPIAPLLARAAAAGRAITTSARTAGSAAARGLRFGPKASVNQPAVVPYSDVIPRNPWLSQETTIGLRDTPIPGFSPHPSLREPLDINALPRFDEIRLPGLHDFPDASSFPGYRPRNQTAKPSTGYPGSSLGQKQANPPVRESIRHTDLSRQHILGGDRGNSSTGGHRAGTGFSGKTEFPKNWSDNDILDAVYQVTQSGRPTKGPYPTKNELGERSSAFDYEGKINGINIRTTVIKDGKIRTGFPTYFLDRGVIKNPKLPKGLPQELVKSIPQGKVPRYSNPQIGGDGSWTWRGNKSGRDIEVILYPDGRWIKIDHGKYIK
ncbi:EndoU domain-containing protein [Nocardia sp. 004]|uniref:EndoU domain-containing protein n=1 Tax=Nocardia sp. 004 TaxID=3385978 RepID=UPI0039A1E31E